MGNPGEGKAGAPGQRQQAGRGGPQSKMGLGEHAPPEGLDGRHAAAIAAVDGAADGRDAAAGLADGQQAGPGWAPWEAGVRYLHLHHQQIWRVEVGSAAPHPQCLPRDALWGWQGGGGGGGGGVVATSPAACYSMPRQAQGGSLLGEGGCSGLPPHRQHRIASRPCLPQTSG